MPLRSLSTRRMRQSYEGVVWWDFRLADGLVCLFVCQHDNFRTIKRRMMKLGG